MLSLELTPEQSARFWKKVDKIGFSGCWIWTGAVRRDGYGLFALKPGIRLSSHRISFLLAGGLLSDEKPCVLHRCDVRLCVNPDHLFAGSFSDNSRDMAAKGRHPSTLYPEKYRGENNGNARLCAQDILDIRQRYSEGCISYAGLGREYGVPKSHISRIILRKAWTHI